MRKEKIDLMASRSFKLVLFTCCIEDYSLDRIKMTKWIWPKFVNMTGKFASTNINMMNMTKKKILWSCSMVNVRRCEFFSHVPILMFVGLKIFWSYSNHNLVILIWSCELASLQSPPIVFAKFNFCSNHTIWIIFPTVSLMRFAQMTQRDRKKERYKKRRNRERVRERKKKKDKKRKKIKKEKSNK